MNQKESALTMLADAGKKAWRVRFEVQVGGFERKRKLNGPEDCDSQI